MSDRDPPEAHGGIRRMYRLGWHMIVDTAIILLAFGLGYLVQEAERVGVNNWIFSKLKVVSQTLFGILAAGYVVQDFYREFWVELLEDTQFGRWLSRSLARLRDGISRHLPGILMVAT
jgi:hypothetical protein